MHRTTLFTGFIATVNPVVDQAHVDFLTQTPRDEQALPQPPPPPSHERRAAAGRVAQARVGPRGGSLRRPRSRRGQDTDAIFERYDEGGEEEEQPLEHPAQREVPQRVASSTSEATGNSTVETIESSNEGQANEGGARAVHL